ncbi:MAG: hypothetical protein IPN06_19545 [Burkholderiales bacterium]|nr:hypothetical protein [Burkholderiales bacterium]
MRLNFLHGDGAMQHMADSVRTVIFVGGEYSTGPSSDWAVMPTLQVGIPIAVDDNHASGIAPYVLRQLLA